MMAATAQTEAQARALIERAEAVSVGQRGWFEREVLAQDHKRRGASS
jgi:hypothetical protein